MALRPARQDDAPLARAVGDASPRRRVLTGVAGRPGRAPQSEDGVLTLAGASLAVEDGLLMVFGPDGDPLPPASFGAAAETQPDCPIRLGDGRSVPARRVAAVLDAQTRGPLAPATEEARAWIHAMLGLGEQAEDAGAEDMAVEADAGEITVFAREILVCAAGGHFLIAPAGSDEAPSGSVVALAEDDSVVPVPALIARLRRSAGAADATDPAGGAAAELTLPGFTFAADDRTLLIATVGGDRFRVADRAEVTPGGAAAAILLTDGQGIAVRELVAALGLQQSEGARGALPEPPVAHDATADQAGLELRSDGPEPTPATTSGACNLPLEAILEVDEPPAVEAEGTAPPPEAPASAIVPLVFGPPLGGGTAAAEFAVVYLGGVPPGAVLSAGIRGPDGSWMLMPGELDGLTLTFAAAPEEPVPLTARAVAIEDRDGTMTVLRQQLVVGAAGPLPADPAASPAAAERHVPLDLAGVMKALGPDVPVDAVVIAGLPPAARLSSGTFAASIGRWVLRPDQLDGLELVAPADAPARVALRVKLVGIDTATGQPNVVTRKLQVACGGGARPRGERPGGVGFFRPLAARRAHDVMTDSPCST